MRIVMIQWDDPTYTGAHWENREPFIERAVNCITCGIVLHENKDTIHIIQSLNSDYYSQGIVIPKCSIKQMWRLKVG